MTLPLTAFFPKANAWVRCGFCPWRRSRTPNRIRACRTPVLEDEISRAICLKERLSSTYFWWRTILFKVTGSVLILETITVLVWRTFPVPGSERSILSQKLDSPKFRTVDFTGNPILKRLTWLSNFGSSHSRVGKRKK